MPRPGCFPLGSPTPCPWIAPGWGQLHFITFQVKSSYQELPRLPWSWAAIQNETNKEITQLGGVTWALLEGAGDNHSEAVPAGWTAYSRGTPQHPSNNHKDGGANSTSLSLAISSDPHERFSFPRALNAAKNTWAWRAAKHTGWGCVCVWCWDLT